MRRRAGGWTADVEWSGFDDDGFVAPPTISPDGLQVGRYRGKDVRIARVDPIECANEDEVDAKFPHMTQFDRTFDYDARTDMVTVRWFVGVAVLDRQSPHLRPAQPQPYRAFWEDPAIINDIFGPPEPWAPLAMARFERAFRDRHQ